MHAFNQSLRYDQRMYAVDIQGSIAYAKSLALVGILTKNEETAIIEGLLAVRKEWEDGSVREVVPSPANPSNTFTSFKSAQTMRIYIPRMNGD